MSCPNRCSNDFKVKNFPDEIECVVADKIKTPQGLRATLLVNGLGTTGVDTSTQVVVLDGAADNSRGEIAASGSFPGARNVILGEI